MNSNNERRMARNLTLALACTLFGRPQRLPLLKPEELRHVLLIRYDRMGDAVITAPVLEGLRRVAPEAEIDVIAGQRNRLFFEEDERVSRTYVWDASIRGLIRLIRQLRPRRYDAVFHLVLNSTTAPAIVAGLIAPTGRTIGRSVPGHERLLNHAVEVSPTLHFRDQTYALLLKGLAIDRPLPVVGYPLMIPERARIAAAHVVADAGLRANAFILLNVSAGGPNREFSDATNAALARALADLGYDVGILAAPGQTARSARIAEQAGKGARPLAFASLNDTIAGIGTSLMVVTPDTSIVHMASGTGRPTVAIYPMAGDPAGWGPIDVPHRIVQAAFGNSVQEIPVETIVETARDLLREIKEERPD